MRGRATSASFRARILGPSRCAATSPNESLKNRLCWLAKCVQEPYTSTEIELARAKRTQMDVKDYQFTNNWFEHGVRGEWENFIPEINPSRILEVGLYEGASVCYLIDKLAAKSDIEIHCIDTWEGGIEHKPGGFLQADMSDVQKEIHAQHQGCL